MLNNIVYYLNEPPDYQQNESDYALPDPEDTVSGVGSHERSELPGMQLFTLSGVAVLGPGNSSRILHSQAERSTSSGDRRSAELCPGHHRLGLHQKVSQRKRSGHGSH